MRRHISTDTIEVCLKAVILAQVAPELVEITVDRVHVGILEPRNQHPTAKVDDLRARASEIHDVVGRADRNDPAITDRDRVGPPACGINRVHRAVQEQQVGRTSVAHLYPSSRRGRHRSRAREHIPARTSAEGRARNRPPLAISRSRSRACRVTERDADATIRSRRQQAGMMGWLLTYGLFGWALRDSNPRPCKGETNVQVRALTCSVLYPGVPARYLGVTRRCYAKCYAIARS